MPNYPSNFNNNTPFNAGPVNNVNLLYEVRNRLLRHNLMPVTRIISDPNIVLNPYTPIDWAVGPVNGWVYGTTVTSGSDLGLADGDVVVLSNRANQTQNGVFKYVVGAAGAGYAKTLYTGQAAIATTGSTGPAFIRVANLFSGAAFPVGNEIAATSYTAAQTYLQQLWNPTEFFGVTGPLAVGPSGIQALLDIAGVAYPQGFRALAGSATDTSGGTSNVNKVIYYQQDNVVTLGTTSLDFSTVNALDASAYPSSRTTGGTDRLVLGTDTLNNFFTTAKVMAQLLDNVAEFREAGGETDMPDAKRAYLTNLSQEKLMRIREKLEIVAPDLYELYVLMWNMTHNFNGTTGPQYPSEYNRGYQLWNTGNY
jgi:hypothetical protein